MPDMTITNQSDRENLVGLIPAAGHATRIQPIPCSKELFPIGFRNVQSPDGKSVTHPMVVSQHLLERMHQAGVHKAYIIVRRGKMDIINFYGSGQIIGMDLAYMVTEVPYGAPFSIRQAFGFVSQATIVFGFPDIIFQPEDAFSRLLAKLKGQNADLVLGLFPAVDPRKMDMVEIGVNGRPKAICIKPEHSHLTYTWIIAVWSPVFTRFMHTYLNEVEPEIHQEYIQSSTNGRHPEYYLGHVIQAALKTDMAIDSLVFEKGRYMDIGTPEDLVRAVREHSFIGGLR
jgi:glucose-1-phosphate thymidylyltransferase